MLSLDINLLFTILNLIIFYLLLRKFLFKPINEIMQKRSEAVKKDFDDAAAAKKDAEELQNKYQNILDSANSERESIIKESRTAAKDEYRRIVETANRKAGEIISDAKRDAENEYRKAVEGAQGEITKLAAEAAEKIAGGKKSDDENSSLYDEFLRRANKSEGNE